MVYHLRDLISVFTLCGPFIQPQPECSYSKCKKGPSAPVVWFGYCQLSIKIHVKALIQACHYQQC